MPLQNNNAGALHGVTNDLLSGYSENPVSPTVNDLLSGYSPSPVVPTVNDLLSGYTLSPVTPTVNTNLDGYQLQPVVPFTTDNIRGEGEFIYSDGSSVSRANLLEPTVRRLSAVNADPVLGSHTHALYSPYIAGQERGEATFTFSKNGGQSVTYTDALAPTMLRASNLSDNPILYSHTHALHSAYIAGQERGEATFTFSKDGGQSVTYTDALAPTMLRAANLANPILGSHTHALHSAYIAGQERGEATFTFSKNGGQSVTYTDALAPTMLRAANLANPILGSHTHALYSAYIAGQVRGEAVFTHSKDGLFTTVVSDALAPTILRASLLADPVLGSHTHALHSAYLGGQVRGEATFTFSKDGSQTVTYNDALAPTVLRASNLANDPILGSHTHALHSAYIAGQVRDEAEFTFSKDGIHTYTATDALAPTVLRAQNLANNPILYSHTHALHSAYLAGQERSAATFTFSKDGGQSTTYNDALAPTVLRAQKLAENPIIYSHTHALHSAYQWGQVRGAATFTFSKNNQQSVTYDDALQPTILRAQNLANNPILYSHTHALHSAYQGGFLREDVSYTLASGQSVTLPNVLNPTVRRITALKENPVTGSHTHALHGKAGSQQLSYAWENPQRFKQQLRNMGTNLNTGALHGVAGSMQPHYAWENPDKFKQQLDNMSGPKPGGALHGIAGTGSPGGILGDMGSKIMDALFGGSEWPMAKFYFYVVVGATELAFQTVEGLEAEIGVIDYRDGNSPFFGKDRMPGLVTYSRVTMKKGMFANDVTVNTFFKEIAQNRQYTTRRTVIIALMDHNHMPQFIWRVEGAFVTKFTPSSLDAESENEIAVEEVEFVGRAWYMDSLTSLATGAVGSLGGAIGGSLGTGLSMGANIAGKLF